MQVEFVIADALHNVLGHDGELDELGQQHRVGAVGRQYDGVVAGRLGADDLVELAELRAGEFGSVMRLTE